MVCLPGKPSGAAGMPGFRGRCDTALRGGAAGGADELLGVWNKSLQKAIFVGFVPDDILVSHKGGTPSEVRGYARPHPGLMASQARLKTVAQYGTCASRKVVPKEKEKRSPRFVNWFGAVAAATHNNCQGGGTFSQRASSARRRSTGRPTTLVKEPEMVSMRRSPCSWMA